MTRKELEDTVIVAGWDSAYIAKRNKSDNIMSEVRRKITENEIYGLVDWLLNNKLEDGNDTIYFESYEKEGYNVEISFVKKEEGL